jgi:hypothetical protein
MSYSQKFVNGQIEQNVARFAMEIYSAWRTGTFHFSKPFIVKKVSKIYTIVKREVRRNVPNLIKVNPAYGDVIIKIKFFKR